MPTGIYVRTPEHGKKISDANKGRPRTEETKQKISASHIGITPSEETLKKMSNSHKGKHTGDKNPMSSPESRKKVSAALIGRPVSESHRLKLIESHKGIYPSEETRIRMSEAQLGGMWYGNVRYEDGPQYCEKWTSDLRERVRAYRGHVCVECGKSQKENGRLLAVHHVHYNKKTCCDGSPHDLVPLCISCHSATNINRDYWEKHFTELIYSNDPNGKCFFTKEEHARGT